MPCESIRKPNQSLSDRKSEVALAVDRFNAGLVSGSVTVTVGPQGAIAFDGLSREERDGVTDACAYRMLMLKGSPLAKVKITKAEQLAGRPISRAVIGQGVHSHDGGKTWHHGH
jgi:hypothetical protein